MIKQHYYTRDKRGIFSKNPGYDTVAKSEKLNDEFIINTLQDLCFYEAPAELAGEEEISKYPEALFSVNTEEGEMIIGKSTFAGLDYTSQRNRYFTHNYIIPKEDKEMYIKNPERIIYSKGFIYNYDINKENIISEVEEISYDCNECKSKSIEEMFNMASINKEIFINLIKASFDAAKHGKKIYIVLNCDSKNINSIAKEILNYLYRVLPYAVRRKIGFITYMKNPKSKNYINIIFLCKGSIKRLTTELKSGYIFDICNREFYIEDIDKRSHVFIDYVMSNIEKVNVINEFFDKIDKYDFKYELNLNKYDDIFSFGKKNEDMDGKNNNKKNNNKCCNDKIQKEKIEHSKNKYIKVITKVLNKIKNFFIK